jgi:hypothetical protein
MKYTTLISSLGLAYQAYASQQSLYKQYGVLEFANFGFEGYYKNVKTLDTSSSCNCELAANDKRTLFKGSNSPLDGEVSVHFRGPLSLKQFGYYVSENFTTGDSSSKDWTRSAFYDGSSSTADNITFITAAGDSSSCLGKALTYADSDGVSKASSNTVLAEDTLITSDEELIFFSNISCDSSGFDKDCGVYRNGIPAYHGYDGTTKMFLFEFTMPQETQKNDTSFEFYDMPAIWLLNAHIPRTSQYPTNANCSCWATGCGEFDIFEVMNGTESQHLYSTIHDYQGTGDIGTGIQAQGWIQRQLNSTMLGGVVFDTEGTVSVFLSNSTSLDSTISASDVNSWISKASSTENEITKSLPSATNTGSGKVSAAAPSLLLSLDMRLVYLAAGIVAFMSLA